MLELAARHGQQRPVRIRDLADTHGMPNGFLVQILLQLKASGLVSSTRGAAGGYRLGRDPAEITLADIIDVIEGGAETPTSNTSVATPTSRVLLETWQELDQAQRELLASISLADLAERATQGADKMYYI